MCIKKMISLNNELKNLSAAKLIYADTYYGMSSMYKVSLKLICVQSFSMMRFVMFFNKCGTSK